MQKAFDEIQVGTARKVSNEPIRAFYDISTGKYNVIDGYHRIANAINKGLDKIKGTIEFEYSGGGTNARDIQLRKIREEANQ